MSKGFPGDVNSLLKQAKDMQSQLERVHEEAQKFSEEGQSGGGMVKAVATGNNRIKSITINAEVVDPQDVEILQDMVLAAINDALAKVQNKVQSELAKVTGGMSIPGLF